MSGEKTCSGCEVRMPEPDLGMCTACYCRIVEVCFAMRGLPLPWADALDAEQQQRDIDEDRPAKGSARG
jgi:hypothetical protein